MRKLSLLFLGAVLSLSCAAPQNSNGSSYKKMDSKEFVESYKENKNNSILIDVRTPGEYNGGTIEDAININYFDNNFEEQLSKLDTTKTAYIFCKSGGRSGQSSKTFLKVGFKNVIDLKGGYSSYK